MALDGNFKLLRLVEDIVKILGIQLGPKEGVPVHCPTSAKIRGIGSLQNKLTSWRQGIKVREALLGQGMRCF